MGHRRKGSPFPLTFARPKQSPSPYTADSDCNSAPATTPTFRVPSPHCSLLSCASDASDPLSNVCKRRALMGKEPAGMILGDSGLPIPSIVPASKLPSVIVTVTTTTTSELEGEEEDTETPVQSPTMPTAGGFAHAQDSSSVTRTDSLVPGLHYKRDRPRQRVPESVFISPQATLDPLVASDSESLAETTYWSARSSFTSFNTSGEEVW
ncbi:hypothetical protein BDP27DRAFT_245722 [Rhodocollybia butyracea]|uniref:Uncharacterized protein n=1 Tax=Rhodocollybia butyracea TaxID=206335 RepID=A0A9P5UCD7_9AGAR|nr:hypothetical protein BDP27DRAFT_245722 [Rhodocollybia butyracea]